MCDELERTVRNEDEPLFKHLLTMIAFISIVNPDEALRILAMLLKDDLDIHSIYQYTLKTLKENKISKYS